MTSSRKKYVAWQAVGFVVYAAVFGHLASEGRVFVVVCGDRILGGAANVLSSLQVLDTSSRRGAGA